MQFLDISLSEYPLEFLRIRHGGGQDAALPQLRAGRAGGRPVHDGERPLRVRHDYPHGGHAGGESL